MRLLFAQAGTAYCPETGEVIKRITPEDVVTHILDFPQGERITLLAPISLEKQDSFEERIAHFQKMGFLRIRLNETLYELDETISFDRKRKNELALVIDRLKVDPDNRSRLFQAVESCAKMGNEKILVMRGDGKDQLFNLAFAVEKTGKSYRKITPHTLSFNSAEGMCPDCQGLGYQYGANLMQNQAVMEHSLRGLLRTIWTHDSLPFFETFLGKKGIDFDLPLEELSTDQLQLIFNGSDELITTKRGFACKWLGIQPILARAGKGAHREIRAPLIPLLDEIECFSCLGSRLNPLARNVRIEGHSISSVCQLPIEKALPFIESLETPTLLDEVMKQLKSRLRFLITVGLNYLTLDRRAPTLSNGEAQRIRLARQLGSELTGVLYVLDEPTIGLHPHDNEKLNGALKQLKALGNTLLMVEHDPLTLAIADHLIDFGPGAGILGGHITAQGTYEEICNNPNSLTGDYLSGRKTIDIPQTRRSPKGYFSIENACKHNLKNLTLEFPIGVMSCLTGISGSGKSTLMHAVIKPMITPLVAKKEPFNKLIVIDQNPIGQTVRADVGTYSDVLPVFRQFFSQLGAARTKGLQPRHFSYNHKKGMCTNCWGLGYKKVEMLFLPPVKVTCDQCEGMRLNPVSLTVDYQGMHFGNLLQLTIEEARAQFELLPKAQRILDTLISVGLGYLKLGQEIASLSGGEAQRIKLSRELAKRGTGKTLYLLDEPTTGLHADDVKKLLALLQRLVEKGNTCIVIEHNVDVIRTADHVIDLSDGAIVAQGTPEEIKKVPHSLTGNYL